MFIAKNPEIGLPMLALSLFAAAAPAPVHDMHVYAGMHKAASAKMAHKLAHDKFGVMLTRFDATEPIVTYSK